MNMKRRILASLLSLMLLIGLFPTAAFAASDNPFTDVETTAWFYDEVQYVYENGLMNGTSGTTFSPNATTTRGMIVAILYRLEGSPSVTTAGTFTDVSSDQYYADAVEWAAANGIVGGYGGDVFGPDDPITREQLAAILYRYAQYKGYDVSVGEDTNILSYADYGELSEYAIPAMQWACGSGLINGTSNTTLSPQDSATRAQVAAILYRFCENILGGINENEFTVTFEYNYGSAGTYKTVTVKNGDTVDEPTDPTRSSYSFSGWYTAASGGSKFDFDTVITADLTLYAHWSYSGGSGDGGHSHSYTVMTGATCTEDGVKTCSCGAEQTIPATGHSWVENEGLSSEATCCAEGIAAYACDVCGATKTETVPATGVHDYEETDSENDGYLDCQTDGCESKKSAAGGHDCLTETKVEQIEGDDVNHRILCAVEGCSASATQPHSFGEVVRSSDETTATWTCSICEYKKTESYVAKINQSYYSNLAGAITDADSDDTIILLADIDGIIAVSQTVTINPNGKTATLSYKNVKDVKLTSADNLTVTVAGKTAAFEDEAVEGLMVVKSAVNAEGNLDIYTLQGLQDFADAVNGGTTYSGNTVKLMKDINLSDVEWTPIGASADDANKFKGTFDGNNKEISNLTIDTATNPQYQATGFFGALNGTAKNFTLNGVTITGLSEGNNVGATNNGIAAVAGSIYNTGTIEGVTVKNANISGNRYVGGVAGYVYGDVKDCTVENSSITATPDNMDGDISYDNGDKVGGIVGYLGEGGCTVSGNTVNNVTLTAYRDVGGVVGCAQSGTTVSENTTVNVNITADQQTNFYETKDFNAGYVVGRNNGGTAEYNDVSNAEGSITLKLPENLAKSLTLTGDTTLVGAKNGSTISVPTSGESAIIIDGDVKLTIEGSVTARGATNGDGIYVPENSSLELTGDALVAVGNNGTEVAPVNNNGGTFGGSGIGNGDQNGKVGEIYIHDMAALTAEGYGRQAFGIGGNMSSNLTIERTTIEYVRGGYARADFKSDYGKTDVDSAEGGAAIGFGIGGTQNLTLTMTSVTVKAADGGWKSAAIGGNHWVSSTIEIVDSDLNDLQGGGGAAAIGAGRMTNGMSVSISITNSSVEATGGEGGAGIGGGYNSGNKTGSVVSIEIAGTSTVEATAKEGRSDYHSTGTESIGVGGNDAYTSVSGSIESTVNIVTNLSVNSGISIE